MKPINSLVRAMLTDTYQLTMAYAYWCAGVHENNAVFDLFYRTPPFGGKFAVFAGLEQVLSVVENLKFPDEDIRFLTQGFLLSEEDQQASFEYGLKTGYYRKVQNSTGYEKFQIGVWGDDAWVEVEYPDQDRFVEPLFPDAPAEFIEWLRNVDCSQVKVYAIAEGSVVFPRIPLVRVEGPLAICQILETIMLNSVNFASLVTTNAARFRLAAGPEAQLLEFGLRRAQGPDGALSASYYSYMGGFNSTSNVLAGQIFGIPHKGTHAHAFVESFLGLDQLKTKTLVGPDGKDWPFVEMVLSIREELGFVHTHEGELAAFIAYAQAFPKAFLALVDTYDTLKSGIPNFLCVAIALERIGYTPRGIRLDSGDLGFYSKEARRMFREADQAMASHISACGILASNDIDEKVLLALKLQGHEINAFGIGTRIATCWAQPAFGAVYKLVEINGQPRIKLSNDDIKITIPGRKEAYRLFGKDGIPLLDLMIRVGEPVPVAGERVLCRDPFDETKRVMVTPSHVMKLHQCVWDGKVVYAQPTVEERRNRVQEQVHSLREDHLRFENPTPYKVSVSDDLYTFLHQLRQDSTPILELA